MVYALPCLSLSASTTASQMSQLTTLSFMYATIMLG